ncbi:MAG: alpha/beta fold hydrolase [Verrucomicrobiota bacterium]|jgi:pimeloyl-ACP methyl ester carboxylesterase
MNPLLITALLCLVISKSAPASPPPVQKKPPAVLPPRDRVILIHGLGRTPLSLIRLQLALERAGYQVTNLRYPSHGGDVEQLAEEYLHKAVVSQNPGAPGKIHFVTHSLGGIIVREYLARHVVTNLGRVVMLAPPNHGSELADHLGKNWLGRLILGPAGREMGTSASDLPARLGPARFQLGVIASDGPGIPWNCLVFHGASDGIVSVQSAKLDGMADFLVVHGSHTLIMWRADVVGQVLAFLGDGHFARIVTDPPGG